MARRHRKLLTVWGVAGKAERGAGAEREPAEALERRTGCVMDATDNEGRGDRRPRLAWRIAELDRYVLSRFLGIYAATLFSFTLLFVLIDLVSTLEKFNKRTAGFADFIDACVLYYTSIVPVVFCQILGPVVCLASALFTVTIFQRSNEFVPMFASGRSPQRTLLPVLLVSAALSAGTFAIQEAWIPRTADSIREALEAKGKDDYEGIKYRDSEHGNLIVLPRYDRVHQKAQGVLVLPIWNKSQYLINAASMEWRKPEVAGEGYWLLREGRLQEYDTSGELVRFQREGWEATSSQLDQFFA
ncbi:MAG: LptF/LptG family permease, partial [bacterium]